MAEIKLVYEQVKEFIEEEAKTKKPGEFLRSEVQYSSLFNISRPTVRKAVDILVDKGLVRRIPGKGLKVAQPDKDIKKGTLLIAIPYRPDDGFSYNMVMGCVDAANQKGLPYRIANQPEPEERLEYLDSINLKDYCAAVAIVHNKTDRDILNLLLDRSIPTVLADNPVVDINCPYVVTNDYRGGYICGEYLSGMGHSRILYISLDRNVQTVIKRERGFEKAMEDNGMDMDDVSVVRLKKDEDIIGFLNKNEGEYTAICGYSDIPVIMAYNVLTKKGIRVPEQVSLMGYGNFSFSSLLKVPLTTICMPVYDMGFKAAQMAVNMGNNTDKGKRIVLDVSIIERESVIRQKGIT